MSVQENVQIVENGFAAFGRGDIQGLLALFAEDSEWISPGEGLPLAGTHRGHAALADFFLKFSEAMEISTLKPHEFVADGDRVLVVGFERSRVKGTNWTFEWHFVLAFTIRNGRVTNVREYTDTLALAQAFGMAASANV